jgi:hypothetical protein
VRVPAITEDRVNSWREHHKVRTGVAYAVAGNLVRNQSMVLLYSVLNSRVAFPDVHSALSSQKPRGPDESLSQPISWKPSSQIRATRQEREVQLSRTRKYPTFARHASRKPLVQQAPLSGLRALGMTTAVMLALSCGGSGRARHQPSPQTLMVD